MRGETKHFVKEFETKRKDREVDRVFKVLERVTDLRDCEVDKLRAQCDSVVPNVNANLLVAQSMCNKILDQSRSTEIVRMPVQVESDSNEYKYQYYVFRIKPWRVVALPARRSGLTLCPTFRTNAQESTTRTTIRRPT